MSFSKPLAKLTLCISLTMLPLFAQARSISGGSDGGGGNTAVSTKVDLEEIINNFGQHLWSISDSYLVGGPLVLTSTPLSPELSQITSTVMGSKNFEINKSIYEYMKTLKFDIVDRPCLDGGRPTDASTLYQKNATICLSATRLSRFPRPVLLEAIIPLILHEVAHQYGLGESEAVGLQKIAEIQLKFRTMYVSARRAFFQCAMITTHKTSTEERAFVWGMLGQKDRTDQWPTLTGASQDQALMYCAMNSSRTGDRLDASFDGDRWTRINKTNLTQSEIQTLVGYTRHSNLSFLTIVESLTNPPESGYNDCANCEKEKIDPPYIMMIGAKAALSYIDLEVARQQSAVVIQR